MISSAAYYYYNEQKGRPHKGIKYVGLCLLSLIVGKLSYVKEGQRRLIESPSQSPFVMELRKNYKRGQYYPSYGANSGSSDDTFKSETSEMNWTDPNTSEFLPDTPMLDPNQPSPIHQQPHPEGKLTYEELRARNREIYEKNTPRGY